MKTIIAILDYLERWGILISFSLSLVALTISIATHYVFQRPLTWPDELTTYLFMFMTFLGASASVKSNMELKVDAIYGVFPQWRFQLDMLLHLVRLGVCITFIYLGWKFVLIEQDMETVTPILLIPMSLIAAMLSFYAYWESRRKGLGKEALERLNFKGLLAAGKNAFFAVFIIFVLFGGIYSGAFTITEASVVSCVLILIVEMLIYRAVSLKDLKELLLSSGVVSGALVITVSGAGVISEYIILRGIPQKILALAMLYIPNAWVYLAFTCVVLLIIGTFMDQIGAIMILVPIMMPIANHLGIDPIHYCLIFTVGLGIGYITPPLGLLLYTAQAIGLIFSRSSGQSIPP